MKITLTPTTANLTAATVSGPVTIPLSRNSPLKAALWRRLIGHKPRPLFVTDPLTGIATKTF